MYFSKNEIKFSKDKLLKVIKMWPNYEEKVFSGIGIIFLTDKRIRIYSDLYKYPTNSLIYFESASNDNIYKIDDLKSNKYFVLMKSLHIVQNDFVIYLSN